MAPWMGYMAASCFAAFLLGGILAWVLDEWNNR